MSGRASCSRAGLLLLGIVVALALGSGPVRAQDRATLRPLLDRALDAAGLRRSDLFLPADLVEADPFRRSVVSRLMEEPLEAPGYCRALAAAMRKQESLLGMFQLALAQERLDLRRPDRTFQIAGKVRYPETSLETILAGVARRAKATLGEDLALLLRLRAEQADLADEARTLYAGEEDEEEGDLLWMREARIFLDRAAAIDRAAIARCGEATLGYVELFAAAMAAIPPELLAREETRDLEIEGLRIRIGGPGDDVHTGAVDLLLDVGGNDVYRDLRFEKPIAGIVDLAGDDVYRASDEFALGAALLGVSILIDLEGDDVYRAGNHGLGCGVLGLGVLDDRAGNDTYHADGVGQGAGVLGWGLLVDRAGNDVYVGRKYVQAFAGVDGFGALLDLAGNDVYAAGGTDADPREAGVTQSMSQGFAFGLRPFASGGIALLHDAAGNDAYEGDYFAQGSSYWFALGALVDKAGNDRYAARRYSGGAGIHLAVGVLVDEAGNDAYSMGTGVGLGCGHDYAHGILLDLAGDDSYQGAWLCLGAGNANGVGILCDVAGRDAYSQTRRSHGWGSWEAKRKAGSIGLLLDGGGDDTHPEPGRDDSAWVRGKWGAGIDGSGGDPFPPIDLAAWLRARPVRTTTTNPYFTRDLAPLTEPVPGPPAEIEEALRILGRFEAGLEEEKKAARRSLAGLARRESASLVPYLISPNVSVVIATDRALVRAAPASVTALKQAAAEATRPRLAAAALRTLSRIEGPEARGALARVVPPHLRGEDRVLRRAAAAAVGPGSNDPSLREAIVALLRSSDLREAAAGARATLALPPAMRVDLLVAMLGHPHHLVRTSAVEALAATGEPARDAIVTAIREGSSDAAVWAIRALADLRGDATDVALVEALARRDHRGLVLAAIVAVEGRDDLGARHAARLAAARAWAAEAR